jgi:hypothetical protein
MSLVQQHALPLPDMPGVGPGWELILPAAERARRATGSTAVKTEELREAIIAACVHLGTRRVAEAFGVSREVVRALRSEAIRDGKLDQLKEEMGRRALGAADKVLDRIEDEIDQLPRNSLAITYGILKDKGLLLTGQPTQRVEHTTGPNHADLNDWIESLPRAVPVPAGDPRGQKGPLIELAPASVLGDSGRSSDSQSLAFCPSPQVARPDGSEAGQTTHAKEAGHE